MGITETSVTNCYRNGCVLTDDERADPYIGDGDVMCQECHNDWRSENESRCPFCEEYYLDEELSECFIIVDTEYGGELGLYRPIEYPFVSQPMIGSPHLWEEKVTKIGSLTRHPCAYETEGCPAAFVCKRCIGYDRS